MLSVASLLIFIRNPSWPTPDKLLLFIVFVSMIFGQSVETLKRFVPFVGVLLAYESLRGFVPRLNTRVEYEWMIVVDRWLFGGTLPSHSLQDILWNGTLRWFDYVLYGTYMLHFVLPFVLAIAIWRFRKSSYWTVVSSFLVTSFLGFFTFLAMPAAPPWMASRDGYIEPLYRISSDVWAAFGLVDFPSVYNKISPNPVAAVPSLHAAYATLFAFFIWKYFGRKAGLIASLYPLAIYFGTVYMAEHYLIDEIIGSIYAGIGYLVIKYCGPLLVRVFMRLHQKRAG